MPRRTAPHHGMPALGTLRRHAATGPGSAPAPPTTPAVAAGALPTITPSPALTAAALTTNTPAALTTNTPHTAAEATPTSAAEVGEANGAMDVEGEGEVASTMRKHQRGADGGVVVVASVQLGGMSPTRVGTSGVRVQHSSPDRN